MASVPSDPKSVLGRVDRDGRLVAADPELERLQVEAGSSIGAALALPQLAALVRIAQQLKIPISRRILAAGREQDVDMWVRAVPEDGDVALSIDHWSARPACAPRISAIASVEHERLEAAPLTWSVDEQLQFVTMAPALAECLSLDPKDISGQQLTKLFRLEEDDDGEMPLLSALAARRSFSGQRVTARESGQELTVDGEVTLAPDGTFAGFEGSATLPEGAGSAPSAAEPMVDKAIQTALRSPLDNIVRSAEAMADRPEAARGDAYSAYAGDIAAAARHLLSVIGSLDQRPAASETNQVDLVELASEAVALTETTARERQIAVTVQPPQSFPARGESRSIVQVLVNLIGNAVRYSPAGSAVTVWFEQSGDSALVHVDDEGPGIDPADQERIFEPFEQGPQSGEGSGLGLAIARRLARSMGGDVRVQSAPGEGSRFTLELPAA